MIEKVRLLNMDNVSELLRAIEYYFILEMQMQLNSALEENDN